VAVAITAHGASTTIMDALESVVHATSDAAHVEVLIDTDGDHETWQQIAHALDQLPSDRFTWTAIDPGRNTGLAAARNRLLERVTAPRVLFLDGDDLLEPAVLTHLTPALNRDPSACFAYGLVTLFGTQSGIANRVPWDPDRLVHGNYIAATALFNTAALRDLGGYDPDMNDRFGGWEDYELWCRIAATGGRGVYLPRPTLRYRQHDHSMVTTMGLDVWSAVAHLQHLHPSLPWPYHLAEDTNAEAVPVLGKTSRRVGMGRLRGLIRRGR
jgi:GT2 family glycosyltransferase